MFGDTLRGRLLHNGTQRRIVSMPHSTFAITTTNTLGVPPTFYFPPTNRGFFLPPPSSAPPTSYYWLIDGIIGQDTGKLFLQAMVIDTTPTGFQQLGTDLVVVDNPSTLPHAWESTSLRLPASSSTFTQNEGLAQMNGYLYLLGNCNGTTACLSRVAEREVVDVAQSKGGGTEQLHMEYYGGEQGWMKDLYEFL